MTYVEKTVMEIGGSVANHHCNQNMATLIVEKIMADTKKACKHEIDKQIASLSPEAKAYCPGFFAAKHLIDQAEVK